MRVTFAHRLQAIIDTDGVSKRDWHVATDLLSQYVKTKRLSSGQSRLVGILEEKNAPEAIAERRGRTSPVIKRLTALSGRIADRSSWDCGFCESLLEQARNERALSPRQIEILEKIEGRYTDEALEAISLWDQSFTAEKREQYEICLAYYKPTRYYKPAIAQYEADATLIPSLSQYTKIVENSYAQKVLTAHFADPLYPVGSMVTVRGSRLPRHTLGCPRTVRGLMCGCHRGKAGSSRTNYLVIKNDLPIRNACKGAKVYELLPIGSAELVRFEERHLKTHRTPKAKR